MEDPEALVEGTVTVTARLAESTNNRERSLLPSDLQTTNAILDRVMGVLEDNEDTMVAMNLQPEEVMQSNAA